MRFDAIKKRTTRGSAVVEASLVTTVLLAFLLSIFEFGYILFEHQTLQYLARNAARYGAVHSSNLTAVQNLVLYGQATIPADNNGAGVFGLTASMVDVERWNSGTPEDRIAVTISNYQYALMLPFLAGSFTGRPIQVSIPVEQ